MVMTSFGPAELDFEENTIEFVDITASYDAIGDELNLWISREGEARPQPHITEPVNAFASVLLSLDTGESVGVRIDNFTAFAIYQHPDLIPLAKFLGIALRTQGDAALFSSRLAIEVTEEGKALRDVALTIIKNIFVVTGGYEPGVFTPDTIEED